MLKPMPTGTQIVKVTPWNTVQTVQTVGYNGNTNMSLAANQIARWEFMALPPMTPASNFASDESANAWGDDAGTTYYAMNAFVGTRARMQFVCDLAAAAECFVRVYGGQRFSSTSLAQYAEFKAGPVPSVIDGIVPTDYMRVDVVAHGAAVSNLTFGIYIYG
jgi:hypothetical protein